MRHWLVLSYAFLFERIRQLLMRSSTTIKWLHAPGFKKLRFFHGQIRAYRAYCAARKNVPAYRDFLAQFPSQHVYFKGLTPFLDKLPEMDKENYIKKYSIEARCVNGKIPNTGVVIDESSGSSGQATHWVRGRAERKQNARMIRFGMQHRFGKKPIFILNAFALGPWATGVNVMLSCLSFSKIKALGPDLAKIEHTLKYFGSQHRYVLMGYPPFLKRLVDQADIDWKKYDISFIFGGESMSEGMRTYLYQKGIKQVISSLGASDLELNIAYENEFTISIRRLLQQYPLLREKVCDRNGALPMIFQYNPADFLMETNAKGELVITIARPNYLSPKIRYNIHDLGQIIEVSTLLEMITSESIAKSEYVLPETDLPILFHYGRSDQTVSFFGANISPNDIQEALSNLPDVFEQISSFCMYVQETTEGDKVFTLALEYNHTSLPDEATRLTIHTTFFQQLERVNQDFREAKRMLPQPEVQLQICIFSSKEGPFAQNDIRIKAKYIQN